MEIDLGPQARKFRDELREWLAENRPEGLDDSVDVRMLMYRGGPEVDEPASEILADKVLDGGVDEEGNIQFALGQQA